MIWTYLLVFTLAAANDLFLARYLILVNRGQVWAAVLFAVIAQITTYLGLILIVLDSLWLFIPLEAGTALGCYLVVSRHKARMESEQEAEQQELEATITKVMRDAGVLPAPKI